MSDAPATADVILAAARRTIRARGPERLTLSAVAAEAGVSRPTVYRWFPTKALLLASITASQVDEFDAGLRALAAAHRDPARRLDAALRYLITYLDDTMGADSIAADPAFALQSLADALQPHADALTSVLGDALDEVPAVAAGRLSCRNAAELLLRVAYSHYLVPHEHPDVLLRSLRALAGIRRGARSAPG